MMRYLLMLTGLVCGLFLCGCNESGNSSNAPDTAAVSFTVQWLEETGTGDDSENLAAALSDDCAGRGVSTVAVRVNTSAGATVSSGTFDCNARQGTLSGITPGSGYTIIVSGLNASGTATHQGQKTGVTLNPGPNNVGTIQVTRINNTKPVAAITSPAGGSTYQPGAAVTFSGTGTDAENGQLSSASLVWTSSRDGQIGTGTSFTFTNLSTGTHTITLTVTDRDGATGTINIGIIVGVCSHNKLPTCEITSPTYDSIYSSGQAITFTGTASDPEDGPLPASVFVWILDDYEIISTGVDRFTKSNLTVGQHTIQLMVKDSNGFIKSSGSHFFTITNPTNQSPTCNITSPAHDSDYEYGEIVSFVSTGSDPEDGTLPASAFVWSFFYGGHNEIINTGNKSFSTSTLPVGELDIKLEVTDSGGLTSYDNIVIQVGKYGVDYNLNTIVGRINLIGSSRIEVTTGDDKKLTLWYNPNLSHQPVGSWILTLNDEDDCQAYSRWIPLFGIPIEQEVRIQYETPSNRLRLVSADQ